MKQFKPKIKWATEWLSTPKSSYINGSWVSNNNAVTESINPATCKVIGAYYSATKDDVDNAAKCARDAFEHGPWTKKINHKERGEIMRELANLVRSNIEELATIETLDNGKTFAESLEDVENVATFFDYYSGFCDKFYGSVNPTNNFFSYTLREPAGVVGQIIPWNYPLDMAGYKLAPALAMQNTIIIKPSEITSLSLVRLFEIFDNSNLLPKGVINLIIGDGTIGSYITNHNDIDKISFTGSTAVGKKLVHASADSNLKSLSLELGGKSPNIIFSDAPDIEFAIQRSFIAMFYGKGEKCSEPTRLLVQKPVYDKVLQGLIQCNKSWKVSDPFDEMSNQGAQVSYEQFNKIMNYIEIGKSEGANLILGGDRNIVGTNANGYFINPTIFADCNNTMRISREEIFGPVLSIIPFTTEEEAIEIANDSIYGLAAGFWTNDVARTQRMSKALKAGQIFINKYGCYEHSSPFGGHKQSGWGMECGDLVLDLYTKRKSVWYAH